MSALWSHPPRDIVKALEMIQGHQCRVVKGMYTTGDRDSER